jgi:hypothetical protein
MRPKIKPLKPTNIVNRTIHKKLIEKQGSDALYDISNITGIFPGTLRRTLETKDAWAQAVHLFDICEYLKLDLMQLLRERKKEIKSGSSKK